MGHAEVSGDGKMRDDVCTHINEAIEALDNLGISVRGEFTADPVGWVNVYCARCLKTYEVVLRGIAYD